MIGRNIKKFRLLSGLSLREMGAMLGVSHQTIKKYEENKMTPNSTMLIEIAKILNVNISDLVYTYNVPNLKYETFRKRTTMSKRKREGLELLIADEIASYLEILNFINEKPTIDKDKWYFKVSGDEDIEDAARVVRTNLNVSHIGALDDLTNRLEENNFIILKVDFDEKFDGFCEMVDGIAFIILSSLGYERNRFTLAHELAHLILKFDEKIEEEKIEKYCDLFASSLLMPKESLKNEFYYGEIIKEPNISLNEVFFLAKKYKVSLNSVIMRLCDIEMIDEKKKKYFFIELSKSGLKTKQLEFVDEYPTRKIKTIFRLEAEKIISTSEAIKYLRVTADEYQRRDFSY